MVFTTHSPIFADMTRFESVRLLRKDDGACRVAQVTERDSEYLREQRDREKLAQYVDPAAGEALFARRVLLVEGHGDRVAAVSVARKLGVDLDAEGLSVVSCGGKGRIPFYARMCRALEIPCLVLHDEDVHTGEEGSLADWQRKENAEAPEMNRRISEAVGDDALIFCVSPSLEAELGIGRSARDKPAQVLSAVEDRTIEECPGQLVGAVRRLIEMAP